jgi:hypothetical protein
MGDAYTILMGGLEGNRLPVIYLEAAWVCEDGVYVNPLKRAIKARLP